MRQLLITLILISSQEVIGQQLVTATNFVLESNTGTPASLDDYKGKIIYLDFWASWCGPCIKSMPEIRKLHEEFGDHPKFEIVGISIDFEKNDWKKALTKLRLPWTNFHVSQGQYAKIRKAYNLETIPKTFLISKKGQVIGESLPLSMVREILNKELN